MHMADGNIRLSPCLLPWLRGGVEYLLAGEELPPEFSLCHAPKASASPRRDRRQEFASAQSAGRQARRSAAPASVAASSGEKVRTVCAERPGAPHFSPAASPAAVAPAFPPPDHWPRVWRERLSAAKPAPVLWTYWSLGQDLCGAPDAARRALLQRLLSDLGHPAGTHSFWPVALPGAEDALEADSGLFWAGAAMLRARAVVVMGRPAARALDLPARLRPFQQTRHNGRLVIVLRDIDFLVEEPHHYDAVREFLRQALACFARTRTES